jgi:hypothetical protein
MRQPEDLCNRAFDALGAGIVIGSITGDGTTESEAVRRIYGPQLRALLRTSNWAFGRKRAPLQLLADATGQTTTVGTQVEPPWLYAYAWPIDGVRARWVPWSGFSPSGLAAPGGAPAVPGQITQAGPANAPQMTGLNVLPLYPFERPARFLCAVSDQYPAVVGPPAWNELPDLEDIEGVGPNSRRVIYTNVPPFGAFGALAGAQLVYTFLCLEIEVWDDLFSEAFVAVLASHLAIPVLVGSKTGPERAAAMKEALTLRAQQIAIAQNAIKQARVASAQEAGFPQRTDHTPDWIRVRRTGRARWGSWDGFGDGAGPGYDYCGWDSFSFSDGSVF